MTTRRCHSLALAVVGALTLSACTPAAQPPAANAPADIAAVNALRTSFASAYNSGNAAALANLYTADAVTNQNHQPSVTGRDAIVASLGATFSQATMQIEIMPDETMTMGDFGFDRGRFRMTITPKAPGAAPMNEEGRYLVLLRKEADGSWRVSRDMDNSTLPATPPAPPVVPVPAPPAP